MSEQFLLCILEDKPTWKEVQLACNNSFAQAYFKEARVILCPPQSLTTVFLRVCSSLRSTALPACPEAGAGCFTGSSVVALPSPVSTNQADESEWGRGRREHRLYLCHR